MSAAPSPLADLRRMRRGFRWGASPPLPASARPYQLPAPPREFPTGWARSPLGCAARAGLQAGALAPLLRSQVDFAVHGRDRLDALGDGPVVLVANHASHLDTAAVLTSLPAARRSRLAVAAATDYFFTDWWRAASTALLFGTVPVDRAGGSSAETLAELLASGWSLLVFAEGGRSADGRLAQFKTGGARLALAAGVPLVPIGLSGTYRAMPKGRPWPRPGRPAVTVRYGAPVRPAPGARPHEVTVALRDAVHRLLVEDDTDWWTALRAAPPPPGAADTGLPRWRRVWASTAEPPRPPRAWR